MSFHHGLSARPPTGLVFVVLGLLAQTAAFNLVGSSPFRCELWSAHVAARRLPGAAGADGVTGL